MYANSVEVTCAALIPAKPIDWIWQDHLAAGKLTLLAGSPGTGKTLVALTCAATVSHGGLYGHRWPDGSFSPTGDVLFWSGEDGIEDTIIPRLMAANADLSRIHVIGATHERGKQRPFNFDTDLPLLETKILQNPNVRLLIIDSIVQAVSGDSHKNSDVRRALEPLVLLAEEHGFAIIGITHVTKHSKGKNPVDRISGSLAFGAVARVVLITSKVASGQMDYETQGSVLVRAKSNLGSDHGGFLYEIQGATVMSAYRPIETSKVSWHDVVEGSASEILAWAEGGESAPEVGAVGQAKTFLLNQLANGSLPAKDVESAATAVGISLSSLKRAKKALRIDSHKTAVCTLWELPSTPLYPMPTMSPVRYDRNGQTHPLPNPQFFFGAMPQGMAPIFSPLAHPDPLGHLGQVDRFSQLAQVAPVGPLDPVASVPQMPATMALHTDTPPPIPAHLVEILTPEAHRAWYQKGAYLCRKWLMLALQQNAMLSSEDQESVSHIGRTVVDRVLDDLFYPEQDHYAALVGYYRAVFECNLVDQPQGKYPNESPA